MSNTQRNMSLDLYPYWGHPYKWSGANSTWFEYLSEAIQEIESQMAKFPLDAETTKRRERACKVLKLLLHYNCDSRQAIEQCKEFQNFYIAMGKGTVDGSNPSPPHDYSGCLEKPPKEKSLLGHWNTFLY